MQYEIAQLVAPQIQYQRNNRVGKLTIVALNQTSRRPQIAYHPRWQTTQHAFRLPVQYFDVPLRSLLHLRCPTTNRGLTVLLLRLLVVIVGYIYNLQLRSLLKLHLRGTTSQSQSESVKSTSKSAFQPASQTATTNYDGNHPNYDVACNLHQQSCNTKRQFRPICLNGMSLYRGYFVPGGMDPSGLNWVRNGDATISHRLVYRWTERIKHFELRDARLGLEMVWRLEARNFERKSDFLVLADRRLNLEMSIAGRTKARNPAAGDPQGAPDQGKLELKNFPLGTDFIQPRRHALLQQSGNIEGWTCQRTFFVRQECKWCAEDERKGELKKYFLKKIFYGELIVDNMGQARCDTGDQLTQLSEEISAPQYNLCGDADAIERTDLPNEIDGPDEIGLEVDQGAGDLLNLFPSYGVPANPSPDDKEGDSPPFSLRDR